MTDDATRFRIAVRSQPSSVHIADIVRSVYNWRVFETEPEPHHFVVYVITPYTIPESQRQEVYRQVWENSPAAVQVEWVFCQEYERGKYNPPW